MFSGYDESEALAREEKEKIKRQKELEETQPAKVVRLPAPRIEKIEKKFKFNWLAFFVMILAIGAALLVGYFIPGPFDEFLTTVVISSIYGFLNAHDFKIKNIFKK